MEPMPISETFQKLAISTESTTEPHSSSFLQKYGTIRICYIVMPLTDLMFERAHLRLDYLKGQANQRAHEFNFLFNTNCGCLNGFDFLRIDFESRDGHRLVDVIHVRPYDSQTLAIFMQKFESCIQKLIDDSIEVFHTVG